jgi:hypothetical protein
MIGGDYDRYSLMYDTRTDLWSWLPLLPRGHNISCNVCLNYNDRAIFTFMLDGKLSMKAGVLPLQKMQTGATKGDVS